MTPAATPDSLATVRLLIVDDDPAFVEMMAALLEEHPELQIVARARHGAEAVELVREIPVDVVLMDVDMPVMDGIEATRQIVALESPPTVIVVTGSDHKDRALEARFAGASDFVRKSRIETDLIPAIRAAASDRRRST